MMLRLKKGNVMVRNSIVFIGAVFGVLMLAQTAGAESGAVPDTLTADQKAAIQAARPEAIGDKPVKIICKTKAKPGTRLGGERICLTKTQWDERSREDRRNLEDMQAKTAAPSGS
ncbi:MAG: hypothetical protein ACXWVO_08025 [Caulobacteraceae bacterium]